MATFPPESHNGDIHSEPEPDALTDPDETTKRIIGSKQESKASAIKIFLLGHAVCTLILTFALYRKDRRSESSHQWVKEELRLAKLESECAVAALLQKTSEQLAWLDAMTVSVKGLEKAIKGKTARNHGVSRNGIHLN